MSQYVKFTGTGPKGLIAAQGNRDLSQGNTLMQLRNAFGTVATPSIIAKARARSTSKILSYPLNVDDDPIQGGHYIMFQIKEQSSKTKLSSPKNVKLSGLEAYEQFAAEFNIDVSIGTSGLGRLGSFVDDPLDDPTVNQFVEEEQGGILNADPKFNRVKDLKARGGGPGASILAEKLAKRKTVKTIALYMPAQVDATYQVTYGDNQIGALAMVGQSILQGLMTPGETITKLRNAFKEIPTLGGEAAQVFIQGHADTTASGARTLMEINRGTVITPRMELMFEGVGRREFSFQFNFIPKSELEAQRVNDIVYNFKKYMMPEYSNPETRREMNIPATFEISYYTSGGENAYLNKISTCFLKQVDVKYGGDRYTAYELTATGDDAHKGQGNPPQKTEMTLTFSELELMSREFIEAGY